MTVSKQKKSEERDRNFLKPKRLSLKKMSSEFLGRGRGAKRKLEQHNASSSKKSRGELQTPFLGPNA